MRLFALGLGYSARRLIARAGGVEAAGTSRTPEAVAALRAEGVEAYLFDGARRDAGLSEAIARAQTLIVSTPPGPNGDPALAALAGEIAAAPDLKRIVYLSTVGVYGDWGGDWVDESSETRATSPRGRRRIEAEAQWRALGADRGVPVEILRLAGIYGPGRNALVKLAEGDARRIVKPGQAFNRIHVDDIAGVALALLAAGGAGGVWNVADREPAPPQDVIAFAAGLMGIRAAAGGAVRGRGAAPKWREASTKTIAASRSTSSSANSAIPAIPELSRGPDGAVAGRRGAVNVAR